MMMKKPEERIDSNGILYYLEINFSQNINKATESDVKCSENKRLF